MLDSKQILPYYAIITIKNDNIFIGDFDHGLDR